MPTSSGALLRGSRLGRVIRSAGARDGAASAARCDLCAASMPEEHRHLLELEGRRVRCICRPCSLLFDGPAAGGARYRLIPDRVRRVEGFTLDDARWSEFAIPVGLAYFFHGSREGHPLAFYPGALGATESRLGLEHWTALEAENPVLRTLEPDVEALLVRRLQGLREHWLVPIDACYRLVAVLRAHWRGLGGGTEVWQAVAEFFDELRRRAKPVDRRGARLASRMQEDNPWGEGHSASNT